MLLFYKNNSLTLRSLFLKHLLGNRMRNTILTKKMRPAHNQMKNLHLKAYLGIITISMTLLTIYLTPERRTLPLQK